MAAGLAGVAMVSLIGAFSMVLSRIGTDPFEDRNGHDRACGVPTACDLALGLTWPDWDFGPGSVRLLHGGWCG